jgi:hypothetical protein
MCLWSSFLVFKAMEIFGRREERTMNKVTMMVASTGIPTPVSEKEKGRKTHRYNPPP